MSCQQTHSSLVIFVNGSANIQGGGLGQGILLVVGDLDLRGNVGIWHETYRVRAGAYECVYSGMPPLGLAKATATRDAVGELESARGRIESN